MGTVIVEGLNYRVKLIIRKAYGFRTLEAAEIALYHALGRLPEPKLTHEFCRGGRKSRIRLDVCTFNRILYTWCSFGSPFSVREREKAVAHGAIG